MKQKETLLRGAINRMEGAAAFRFVRYALAGFFTTLVGFISFWFLIGPLNSEVNSANVVSIFLAVFFAYFINKHFVFKSRCYNLKAVVKEAVYFFFYRGAAILLELVGLFMFYSVLRLSPIVSKVAIGIFVFIFNYLTSQHLVFKKSELL